MSGRLIALFVFAHGLVFAQHEAVQRGRMLFVKNCSACHGDTGKGGRGPDVTTGQWKHGGSDESLLRNITKGIAGTQMPPIPLPDEDAKAVIAFMRSLTSKDEVITGNVEKGRELFRSAGCAGCHWFAGKGGIQGPDLTNVRARRKSAGVRKAMAAPLEVTTAGAVQGFTRYEDTFNIHLIDRQSKWRRLEKHNLQITKSTMPHAKVSGTDADDLVAFLLKAPMTGEAGEWKPAADFNVTFDRLKNSDAEPQNWLHYWGNFQGTHYSKLNQITPANVSNLRSVWTHQFGGNTIETTPVVVDGVMFVTGPLNNAAALDARTGRPIWTYTRQLPQVASHCTVMTNRGVAVLGDRVYLATLDTRLVALDAKSGNVIWDVEVDDYKKGFSITHAPLAIDGKIIVGVTSGECALTGFVDAFDARTGKKLWRVYSTPQPGDPARKTWQPESSADYGGAPTWMTGTYDPDTKTVFWTTGNPGPDYDGSVRLGDNLYACSVLAIDAGTGKLKWWFQFTPHDTHDWDGNQTPMLIDSVVRGKPRKLLVTAQRNAFYFVLDRVTGEFVAGKAFAKQTWARGLDDKGRPIVIPNTDPTPEGNYVCPDAAGATNWAAPSYDPATGYFLVSVHEACATYTSVTKDPKPGEGYTGGGQEIDAKVGHPGSIRALEATTGDVKWNYPIQIGNHATGVLGTGGNVVFAASNDGNLIALDAKTGRYLWHYYTGAAVITSPMSYAVNGKQYVALASQSALFVFALP
ncbi:MAG: PQQ-dependent dehydrogenase, methanol/ethanol family [Bryobacterales bacterium]|nr:PQQ-dependent dehydrogenase, methanol/ethanol family [Bryobacterales bacterium]